MITSPATARDDALLAMATEPLCFVCLDTCCHNTTCHDKLQRLKPRLLTLLKQTQGKEDMTDIRNICGQTGFISTVHKAHRRRIFLSWEHYSGSFLNPVPATRSNERCGEYEDLYEGQQRLLRADCLRHIIDYLYAE